jgi:hypothetical protein
MLPEAEVHWAVVEIAFTLTLQSEYPTASP